MFAWNEIRDHLMQSSSTLGFQRNFDLLRRQHTSLIRLSDPAALMDGLHRGAGSSDDKNVVLIALIETAQSNSAAADCALTLMLLALWPGLDAVRRRSKWRCTGTPDELTSEVLSRAIEAIRCIDLARVHRIAATILRNVERDIARDRQREAKRQSQNSDTNPDEIAATSDAQVCLEHLYGDVTGIIGGDAALVMRVAVAGFSQAEVAVELGLSESATRKRYQRATRRLRDGLSEFV
jgi:DNA-directed RNA polymerase specialized sigma24 family protein